MRVANLRYVKPEASVTGQFRPAKYIIADQDLIVLFEVAPRAHGDVEFACSELFPCTCLSVRPVRGRSLWE